MNRNDPDSNESKLNTQEEGANQSSNNEEWAAEDDAVIGKAFLWSFGVLVTVVLSAGGYFLFFKSSGETTIKSQTKPTAAEQASPIPVAVPHTPFKNITDQAGILFRHSNGARGEKFLPETMGGGCVFFDFDNDNDPDLFFVNSSNLPGNPPTEGEFPTMALYENQGDGTFRDITSDSGLGIACYGMGAAAADYDNDGLIDLFITVVGPNRLFHNLGKGRFEEVTSSAGVAGEKEEWSTGSTWVDIENDGDLDLFVVNYVHWTREIDYQVGFTLDGTNRAYGPPKDFKGTFCTLYRNDGEGLFTDISQESGIEVRNPVTGVPEAKSLGVAPIDLNSDGLIDLIVANDTVPNFMFRNKGNGKFQEMGMLSGIAFDSYGNVRGAMGIDAAYYRNDDALGIAIGNFANEMIALYVSSPSKPLQFTDDAITEGIGHESRLSLKFGLFFFDYDLDGWLDLMTNNGHLQEEITRLQKSQTFAQSAQLFWNAQGGGENGFIGVSSAQTGEEFFQPIVGRGSAFADIDQDGDLDVLLMQLDGAPLLLRNDQALANHWIRFRLIGSQSNRDAIGSWIIVETAAGKMKRQVMPTRSYLSQSELPVTFGLGKQTEIRSVQVQWAGGDLQTLTDLQIDQLNIIKQPEPVGP
ncbi:MAG TPA: CRTAC1 family protein [Verrucomicrobiales bacterium]|nr:CRTAC1 family protein [Verrucomicrobiales bacterium]